MPTKCFHDELDNLVFQIPNYVCSPFATNAHKENPKNHLNSHQNNITKQLSKLHELVIKNHLCSHPKEYKLCNKIVVEDLVMKTHSFFIPSLKKFVLSPKRK